MFTTLDVCTRAKRLRSRVTTRTVIGMQRTQPPSTTSGNSEVKPLKTPEEAAELIRGTGDHPSAHWLRRNGGKGLIPCHRVTGRKVVMFSEEDIRWIQESMADPALSQIPANNARH